MDNHENAGFDFGSIHGNKDSNRKAKPPVRVGRKATGLAGGIPGLPKSSTIDFLDSRVAEVMRRLGFFISVNRGERR